MDTFPIVSIAWQLTKCLNRVDKKWRKVFARKGREKTGFWKNTDAEKRLLKLIFVELCL